MQRIIAVFISILLGALLAVWIVPANAARPLTSYTAVNGRITNTSCRCAMCQTARAAAAAGRTKVCWGGKCYPIRQLTQPTKRAAPQPVAPRPLPAITYNYPVFNLAPGERLVTPTKEVSPKAAPVAKQQVAADPITAFDPTPEVAAQIAVGLARVQKGDTVFDLGCGDGRFLEYAAASGARCVGVEINPKTVELARKRTCNLPNVSIVKRDIFETDFSSADVVFVYLYTDMIRDLVPRFQSLRKGSRIVSFSHPIPGVDAKEHQIAGHRFYVWTVGEQTSESLASVVAPEWLKGF